ncbi:hypothetical protein [Aliikangiella coralliicola]|uniref:Uncharacterized protein n=1 Tax=Aliikangiella coralliicola TaxID=2592383 RepID=A0A545U750_9GAMM|nr:hypothetical protein [Aliikangiella coralliicola]TQV85309.1 hypothetical protein FLL46_19270 [Aliikangiella coralliicola]
MNTTTNNKKVLSQNALANIIATVATGISVFAFVLQQMASEESNRLSEKIAELSIRPYVHFELKRPGFESGDYYELYLKNTGNGVAVVKELSLHYLSSTSPDSTCVQIIDNDSDANTWESFLSKFQVYRNLKSDVDALSGKKLDVAFNWPSSTQPIGGQGSRFLLRWPIGAFSKDFLKEFNIKAVVHAVVKEDENKQPFTQEVLLLNQKSHKPHENTERCRYSQSS